MLALLGDLPLVLGEIAVKVVQLLSLEHDELFCDGVEKLQAMVSCLASYVGFLSLTSMSWATVTTVLALSTTNCWSQRILGMSR